MCIALLFFTETDKKYKIQPIIAKFTNVMRYAVKYDNAVVGNCPEI